MLNLLTGFEWKRSSRHVKELWAGVSFSCNIFQSKVYNSHSTRSIIVSVHFLGDVRTDSSLSIKFWCLSSQNRIEIYPNSVLNWKGKLSINICQSHTCDNIYFIPKTRRPIPVTRRRLEAAQWWNLLGEIFRPLKTLLLQLCVGVCVKSTELIRTFRVAGHYKQRRGRKLSFSHCSLVANLPINLMILMLTILRKLLEKISWENV